MNGSFALPFWRTDAEKVGEEESIPLVWAGPVRVVGTVGRTDAAVERTGTYSQRVPTARAGPDAPSDRLNRSRMRPGGGSWSAPSIPRSSSSTRRSSPGSWIRGLRRLRRCRSWAPPSRCRCCRCTAATWPQRRCVDEVIGAVDDPWLVYATRSTCRGDLQVWPGGPAARMFRGVHAP